MEQFDSQIPNVKEIPSHSSKNEQIMILLERQREQILADYRAEIQKHEFQADYDRRNIPKLEELKRFQGPTFDEFSRRRLIEDRDTILELTSKIQELQNEVNCMNDLIDLKDAESLRSGLSHVTSQPA